MTTTAGAADSAGAARGGDGSNFSFTFRTPFTFVAPWFYIIAMGFSLVIATTHLETGVFLAVGSMLLLTCTWMLVYRLYVPRRLTIADSIIRIEARGGRLTVLSTGVHDLSLNQFGRLGSSLVYSTKSPPRRVRFFVLTRGQTEYALRNGM